MDNMATEIEHKYLVKTDSFKERTSRVIHIRQGYLCREKDRTVRVRITDNKAFVTIKGRGHGSARAEFEYEIPRQDGEQLLTMCLDHVIDKSRHIVIDHDNKWEVDVYHGRLQGLVTAELEIPDENYTYPLPDFLGENVTDEHRFSNATLSLI